MIFRKWQLIAILTVLGAAYPLFSQGSDQPKSVKLSPDESMRRLEKDPNYVDLATLKGVKIDLKYATADNFMHEVLYGPHAKCFLHKVAATKFRKAIRLLKKERPGWSFVVFDGLRPRSVQWRMWDRVKDTPNKRYVADANRGSVHNYGFAMDLSLLDEKGKEVDMGTPYDSFSSLAEPQYEEKFLKEGKLTQEQVENRLVLRRVMTGAGFKNIPNEWWHFDGLPQKELEAKYHMVE